MSKKYPNPKIDCRCGRVISGTNRVRVRYRGPSDNRPDWKILERQYRCPACGWLLWHEVAAKPVEGSLL